MTWVLESLNVPVAVKGNLVARGMVRPAGETAIATTVALVTSSVATAPTDPTVAPMVVLPGARPRAKPLPLPIFATAVLDEVHAARVVRSRVLPSLKVPIAENCRLVV